MLTREEGLPPGKPQGTRRHHDTRQFHVLSKAPGRRHHCLGWGPRGVEVVPSPTTSNQERTLGLLSNKMPTPPV